MLKRFGNGRFAFTLAIGKSKYKTKEVLDSCVRNNYEISRLETQCLGKWVCYSMFKETSTIIKGPKEVAFIRGYYTDEHTFHIQRIKNLLKDRISGLKYIPKIYECMEKDLRAKGVEKLTAAVYLNLAPIVMKRWGFSSPNGKSASDIRKSFLRRFPLTTCLEKPLE